MRLLGKVVLCGVAALLVLAPRASAQAWGTIKGQAIYKNNKAPEAKKLDVKGQDKKACLKNGPIIAEEYVINPKNNGVKWVVVWLAKDDGNGEADFAADLPIHPALAKPKAKSVSMDQPCCKFEPHVAVVRKGQDFIGKNSSTIQHNMNIQSSKGPNVNQLLVPGGQMVVKADKWKPHYLPASVSCNIHPWMQAKIFCFDHPYFAVTDADGNFEIKDAPAGKYRLIVWQEGMGWVAGDKGPSKHGKLIDIKAGGVTDVGKLGIE